MPTPELAKGSTRSGPAWACRPRKDGADLELPKPAAPTVRSSGGRHAHASPRKDPAVDRAAWAWHPPPDPIREGHPFRQRCNRS